jgi:hypothetical protein
LFLWPFHLLLQLSSLPLHAYALAYALLTSLGYIPLALLLERRAERRYAWPVQLIGYAVSAGAVLASLLGRLDLFPQNLPWVGVATPLVATGLYIFSLYCWRHVGLAWAGLLTLAIAFGQTLTLLGVPPVYDAAAWVGLALACLLSERRLLQGQGEAWFRVFRWPGWLSSAPWAGC